MRLIDADALKTDLTRFYDNEVTAKRLIDEQPTIDTIPLDWIEQRMNETADGLELNFELNNALFIVGVEWERWKKEHETD